MTVLREPFAAPLHALCAGAKHELVIVSPWIQHAALSYILPPSRARRLTLRVLTVGDLEDFITGSSSLEALEYLAGMGAEVRLAANLHAKAYVADGTRAVITSANLTRPGLHTNAEIGIVLEGPMLVKQVQEAIQEWFEKARPADLAWLASMRDLLAAERSPSESYAAARRRLRGKGASLRGPRVGKAGGEAVVPPGPLVGAFREGVVAWPRFRRCPELVPEFVRFFELAFTHLPDCTREKAWFGVHADRISLTVGNIWLAAIWARKGGQVVVLTQGFPGLPTGHLDPARSTAQYSPLDFCFHPWSAVREVNASRDLWASYAAACERVLEAPIARNEIRTNLANKRRLREVLGHE